MNERETPTGGRNRVGHRRDAWGAAGLAVLALGVGVFLVRSPATRAVRPDPATLTVIGSGQVTEPPGEAQIALGTQVQAAQAATAMAQESARMDAIVAALEAAGVAKSDIQTQGYSISPNTNANGTVTGFTVSDTLQVTTTDLSKVGQILDRAVSAGANTVEDVSFTVSHPASYETLAEAAALADAHRQALAAAIRLGRHLGPVTSVNLEPNASGGPIFAQATVHASAAPDILPPASLTVTSQVQVEYTLLP